MEAIAQVKKQYTLTITLDEEALDLLRDRILRMSVSIPQFLAEHHDLGEKEALKLKALMDELYDGSNPF